MQTRERRRRRAGSSGARRERTTWKQYKTVKHSERSKHFPPYVHLLTCKALAGPNIHPSYNPSVNRLRSFRLRWSTQPAAGKEGAQRCEWSCVEAACIISSIHKKTPRGKWWRVITQQAAVLPVQISFFLVRACLYDRQVRMFRIIKKITLRCFHISRVHVRRTKWRFVFILIVYFFLHMYVTFRL